MPSPTSKSRKPTLRGPDRVQSVNHCRLNAGIRLSAAASRQSGCDASSQSSRSQPPPAAKQKAKNHEPTLLAVELTCDPGLASADDLGEILKSPRKAFIEFRGALIPVELRCI